MNAMTSQFVQIFRKLHCNSLIKNLETDLSEFEFEGLAVPLTINTSNQSGNCYICRPSMAYIDYAIDEMRNFVSNPILKKSLTAIVHCLAPLVKAAGLDEQVQINNWLLSTNPVPALSIEQLRAIISQFIHSHPKSTLVVRSLNFRTDKATIEALTSCGFSLLPSRQVYIFDGSIKDGNHRRTIMRDHRMREKNGYKTVAHKDFTKVDFLRCERLYNQLYLEKYSTLNPHYAAQFFEEMHARGLIKLAGVRNLDGVLDAFSGIFEIKNLMTQPFVGYDTSLAQERGLYRIAMSFGIEHALQHGRIFNLSSGAASFKRNRGAIGEIEYMAFYNQHLGLGQRLATAAMQKILNTIGVPLIRRFEL